MTILQVYLMPRFDRSYFNFGEGDMYATGLYLTDYLNTVCSGVTGFDSADFHWEGSASSVRDTDLVCYVLADQSRSIVARHSSDPLGGGGSTVWSTRANAMISEVYMMAVEGDASRSRLLANLIFHELMHNKLDSHPTHSILPDVHAIPNGRLSRIPVNSSMRPSDADVAAMRRGIRPSMPQYTGSF